MPERITDVGNSKSPKKRRRPPFKAFVFRKKRERTKKKDKKSHVQN